MENKCNFCVGRGVIAAGRDAQAFLKHGALHIEINEDVLCVGVDDCDGDHFQVNVEIDEIILPIKFCPMCRKELKS